jgi:hypothetical protein
MFFTRDEKQVCNGIVNAKIYITLAEDLMSYESQAERTVMDTSGKVLNVLSGLSGRSERMEAEYPEAALLNRQHEPRRTDGASGDQPTAVAPPDSAQWWRPATSVGSLTRRDSVLSRGVS